MPKKSKKDDKKKSKVKKIPAKAGAKARVSKDGKVEVILPVDRSRGPYKPRKTEEEKLQERLQELRAQQRRQYSRELLAPERITGSYRTGGSIYRSDVQAPTGGFTNLTTEKENKRLKEVEKKLDKLLEKEEPKKVEPAPAPAPKKPLIQEVSSRPLATQRRATSQLSGQSLRQKESKSIVADIGSGVSALASAGLSAGVGLATAGLSGLVSTAEREIEAGRERKREADIKRQQEEQERKEKERKQKITDATQERLKRVDERLKTGSGIADSILGGEREKVITLRAEPNIAKEKRELERRQKALREEKERKDKEEAFKLQEKLDREKKLVREKEREQARKDAEDIFSELELAPRKPPEPIKIEDIEDEDTDEEFQDVKEVEAPTPPPREKVKEKKPTAPELPPRDKPPALPPRDDDAEQKRQQILQDQEIARNLLREEARNKDRKIKEQQEKANELEKLNREFIAHKNREDRNKRRREQKQKEEERKEIARRVAGDIVNKAEVEEEVEKIVLGGATAGLIEKAPVSAGRGRKVDYDKLLDTGANRQQIQDYEDDLKRLKRLTDGIYSAFGINLTGSAGGLDYNKKTSSKDDRLRIRRDSIKKLRERGFLVNQIQEFTRTLDEINELIARRDKFGRDFQRRGGAVEQRAGRGRGRAGRPARGRGQRVPEQVAEIEERERQARE